jgi:hypothetical protein
LKARGHPAVFEKTTGMEIAKQSLFAILALAILGSFAPTVWKEKKRGDDCTPGQIFQTISN